jgi:hypothetical protein
MLCTFRHTNNAVVKLKTVTIITAILRDSFHKTYFIVLFNKGC